ncbi:hypothetical protein BaRGS_00021681, partial [Batillaria attramentaria]
LVTTPRENAPERVRPEPETRKHRTRHPMGFPFLPTAVKMRIRRFTEREIEAYVAVRRDLWAGLRRLAFRYFSPD